MNTIEFVKELRAMAEVLKPLTNSALPGSATWNGIKYVKSERTVPDPYALSWWSTLNVVANLIEAQGSALTSKQMSYLKGLLFGGAGSLNDLFLEVNHVINQQLNERRNALFAAFCDTD